jgi:hypothetical protein
MCPFLPDSPRLLIRKGKHEEALEVLAALEGHGATPDSPVVIAQYNIIKDILDREHMNTYPWWQLLSGKGPSGVLRRMILGAWMQVMNQVGKFEANREAFATSRLTSTPDIWHQRNLLLHELYLHQRARHLGTAIAYLGRCRVRRLPNLRMFGILRH